MSRARKCRQPMLIHVCEVLLHDAQLAAQRLVTPVWPSMCGYGRTRHPRCSQSGPAHDHHHCDAASADNDNGP